ncbi:unnamed protein product [Urochloa humidicola]
MDDDIPPEEWWPGYAYGCFYWKVPGSNKLLKLDVNRMEFSAVGLPPNHEHRDVAVAEAGEGRFGIVSVIHNGPEVHDSLCYSIRQNENEIANQHPVETTIALPNVYDKYGVVAAAEGCFFLLVSRFISRRVTGGALCSRIFPYFGFPPFMSPRRI